MLPNLNPLYKTYYIFILTKLTQGQWVLKVSWNGCCSVCCRLTCIFFTFTIHVLYILSPSPLGKDLHLGRIFHMVPNLWSIHVQWLLWLEKLVIFFMTKFSLILRLDIWAKDNSDITVGTFISGFLWSTHLECLIIWPNMLPQINILMTMFGTTSQLD